jgi:acetylornithine/succinyldiaminopimelate/putrescine aminotransferase
MPVGAAMVSRKVAETISPGDHGTTYGGNLLACRAALVFLDELDGGLQAHVRTVSAHLFNGLRALQQKHAVITEVRGLGLIAGLDFAKDPTAVVAAALERGLLINRTANTVIRLLPAYIVTVEEIDEAAVVARCRDYRGRHCRRAGL